MKTLACILSFLMFSSVSAADLFKDVAASCEKGESKACRMLAKACDEDKEAGACYTLSYALGLQGADHEGLEYLNKACRLGSKAACRFIPEVEEDIRKKQASKK